MKKIEHRNIPDNIVRTFCNVLTIQGKQFKAEKIVLEVLEELKKLSKRSIDPVLILSEAIAKCEPPLKTFPKVVGGKVYRLPQIIRAKRAQTWAIKWILKIVAAKKGLGTFVERLAHEIYMIYSQSKSLAFKSRDELVNVIRDNRPFLRFIQAKKKKFRKNK
jgi:small subunit ribosomal protein S7